MACNPCNMKTDRTASTVISHLYQNPDGEWVLQDNATHSQGVAALAAEFAARFGLDKFGYVAGLLHDLGKQRREFQQYIRQANGLPTTQASCTEHHHAYVGMLAAFKLYAPPLALLIGSIIEGHHRGLYDLQSDRMQQRLHKALPPEIKLPEALHSQAMTDQIKAIQPLGQRDLHMLIRMLFSCLVDADYLDTEAFMTQQPYTVPQNRMSELHETLKLHIAQLEASCARSQLNDIRHYIVQQCRASSHSDRGVFSLTVPTGGGKTISALVWAIAHALNNGMERVIIAIPYTSIIEQTAQVLRSIFGRDAVLEHHSLMDLEQADEDEYTRSIRQKTANWDAPIIVTTNVQLFESLFSHKPSKVRKLHNICNSVIILDEAQALPVTLLNPIIDSLDTLVRKFRCSVLISTATQPVLGREHRGTLPTVKMNGFPMLRELIPTGANLFARMQRTRVSYIDTPITYQTIADCMMQHGNVLCIVNTRRDASEIYKLLPRTATTFHLSKNMHPTHIKQVIGQIKDLLKAGTHTDIKVISTQLIEAGVDIDFPTVMRQEAGLDSIIQAAGRCNREGRLDSGQVSVFKIEGRPPVPGMIARGNDARRALRYQTDIHNPGVIEDYYSRLYQRCDTFDCIEVDKVKHKVSDLLAGLPHFETVGNAFRLINDSTRPVIIACEDNAAEIALLKAGHISRRLLRQLSGYSVSVREYTFNQLLRNGQIECWHQAFHVMTNPLFYDDTGLRLADDLAQEIFIV